MKETRIVASAFEKLRSSSTIEPRDIPVGAEIGEADAGLLSTPASCARCTRIPLLRYEMRTRFDHGCAITERVLIQAGHWEFR
jgi:hypothetical protein